MSWSKTTKVATPLWSRNTRNDKLLTEENGGLLLELGGYILNESSSLALSWSKTNKVATPNWSAISKINTPIWSAVSKITTPIWSLASGWFCENIDINCEDINFNCEDMG